MCTGHLAYTGLVAAFAHIGWPRFELDLSINCSRTKAECSLHILGRRPFSVGSGTSKEILPTAHRSVDVSQTARNSTAFRLEHVPLSDQVLTTDTHLQSTFDVHLPSNL